MYFKSRGSLLKKGRLNDFKILVISSDLTENAITSKNLIKLTLVISLILDWFHTDSLLGAWMISRMINPSL